MSKTITIDPVTRVEGHGKITIDLNDQGMVDDARFHVTQFRGFEKFVQGRPLHEMPSLTARVCGICPVSHMLASGQACDALLTVTIPETAHKLRQVLNYAQYVQSHALSFFHLSAPDLLLGFDSDPALRNVVGLVQRDPELARAGIRLRMIGQTIIENLAGKRVHAPWVVPGGVKSGMSEAVRQDALASLPEAYDTIDLALELFQKIAGQFQREIDSFGNFPSLYMGLVNDDGNFEFYDGTLRLVDQDGNILEKGIVAAEYDRYIAEAVEPHSYMKFPYFKPYGYEKGFYRVGPMARCNIVDAAGTPRADAALEVFRGGSMQRAPKQSSFFYHWARLIEILHSIERLEILLNDPVITSNRFRGKADPNADRGVGIIEAPRGTLIHEYRIDDQNLMTWANLIVATGHNNTAINRGVLQVAEEFINKGDTVEEGMLNRCEALVRCYDPCLSCATHAIGQMPLHVQIRDSEGAVVKTLVRD